MLLQKIHLLLRETLSQFISVFRKERLYGLYAFFFFTVFFLSAYLALDDVMPLDDHFFHIRFAETIREIGPRAFTDFQSVYFSKIVANHEHLIYYNFLFYLVLLPFSLLSPLVLGIKLFGVFALALSLTVVFLFLRGIFVRSAFLWTLFFLIVLAESGILVRFLSARPFTLAPVLVIGLLYFLHRKKYWFSLLVSLAYFYWHTATFFLPFLLALAYFVFDRYHRPDEKPEWRVLSLPFLGTVLAVFSSYLIFPGVLTYLEDITLPVLLDAALPGGAGVAEGAEVYGANFFFIFSALSPLIGLLIIFGCTEKERLFPSQKKTNQDAASRLEVLRTTLFTGSVVLLVASLFSLRFADYFVYFCLLYVALAAQTFLAGIPSTNAPIGRSLRIGGLIVLALFLADVGPKLYKYTREVPSYLMAEGPTDWMKEHLAPGTLLFNTDWDAQPLLYYFVGDQFRFATGLEPRFLYDYDARLYWLWWHIGESGTYCEEPHCQNELDHESETVRGKERYGRLEEAEGERIAEALLQDFGTDIIVTRTDRTKLIELLDHSPRFRKEYSDPDNSLFAIYRVLKNDSMVNREPGRLLPE